MSVIRRSKADYPKCECPEASGMCCGGFGPATIEATRDGKRLKLCSKCDLRSDKDHEYLVHPSDVNIMEFDYLGAFVMAGHLSDEKSWRASGYKLRHEKAWMKYWKQNAKTEAPA